MMLPSATPAATSAAAAPPVPAVWRADPGWRRIDLLSDVHLHADMPHTFAAWREHLLATPADAVLMLGDLFEAWVGDDARHQGFEADCAEVLRQAAQRRTLAFLPGNRDFLVGDALLADCGMQRLADPTLLEAFGRRWLLTHGDALCTADHDYQRFRTMVRDAGWQQAFLARPLAERRALARAMRDASQSHQQALGDAMATIADVDAAEVDRWLEAAGTDAMVHGHTHRPAHHALPGGRSRDVLGDWDLDTPSARRRRARILRLSADGLQPIDLAEAGPPATGAVQ